MRNKLVCGILSALFTVASVSSSTAQLDRDFIEHRGWSIGMTVGMADLWGDVGTKSPIDHYNNMNYSDNMHGMGGLFARYAFQAGFALRLGVNYGMVGAADNMNIDRVKKTETMDKDPYQRYLRNLDVRTRIWEIGFLCEFQPLRFNPESRIARMSWQPSLLIGFNAFNFRPQGKFKSKNGGAATGQWIDLYDLHIEGDGFDFPGAPAKYNLWQFNIPIGIGSKWDLSKSVALSIEYVYRMTFTDYLDNVSQKYIDPALYDKYLTPQKAELAKAMADKSWEIDQSITHQPGELRGNNKGKDGYSTISLTFFYKFKKKYDRWWE